MEHFNSEGSGKKLKEVGVHWAMPQDKTITKNDGNSEVGVVKADENGDFVVDVLIPEESEIAVKIDCEIWHENWTTAELFFAMDGQWRYNPQGGPPIALDFTSLSGIMDIHDIPKDDRKETLRHLRIIEGGAVEELYAQYKKNQKQNKLK